MVENSNSSKWHTIFENVDSLKNLNKEERITTIHKFIDTLEGLENISPGILRNMRKDSKRAMYDFEVSKGETKLKYEDWDKNYERNGLDNSTTYQGPRAFDMFSMRQEPRENINPDSKKLYDLINENIHKNDLRDTWNVLKRPDKMALAVAKTANDIAALGYGVGRSAADNAIRLSDGEDTQFLGDISKYFKEGSNTTIGKYINEAYSNAIKDDPELYAAIHSVTTDIVAGLVPAGIIAKGLGKSAAAAGKIASTIKPTSGQIARIIGGKVGESVAIGQVIRSTADILDKQLTRSSMNQDEKDGTMALATLFAGIAVGGGIGKFTDSKIIKPIQNDIVKRVAIRKSANAQLDDMIADKKAWDDFTKDDKSLSRFEKTGENELTQIDNAQVARHPDFDKILTTDGLSVLTKSEDLLVNLLKDPEMQKAPEMIKIIEGELNKLAQLKAAGKLNEARALDNLIYKANMKIKNGELLTPEEYSALQKTYTKSQTGTTLEPDNLVRLDENGQILPEVIPETQNGKLTSDFRIDSDIPNFLSNIRNLTSKAYKVDETRDFIQGLRDVISQRTSKLEVGTTKDTATSDFIQGLRDLSNKRAKDAKYNYNKSLWRDIKSDQGEKVFGTEELGQLSEESAKVRTEKSDTAENFIKSLRENSKKTEKLTSSVEESNNAIEIINKIAEENPKTPTQTRVLREAEGTIVNLNDSGDIAKAATEISNVKATAAVASEGVENIIKQLDFEISDIDKRLNYLEGRFKKEGIAKRAEITQAMIDLEKRKLELTNNKARVQNLPMKKSEALSKDKIPNLEDLTTYERLNVLRLANIVNDGKTLLFGRELTPIEAQKTIQDILAHPSSYNGRMFDYSENALNITKDKIHAGYIETKYPELSKFLSLYPLEEAKATQMYNVNTVVGIMQSMVDNIGFGTSPAKFEAMKVPMQQAFQLWDEIKLDIGTYGQKGQAVNSFLRENCKKFNLNTKQAAKVANAITDTMPNISLAIEFGAALPRGVQGMANYLTKMLTVGENIEGLNSLLHEVGHMNFYYGLNAAEKMAWINDMRKNANSIESWANSYPEFAERYKVLQEAQVTEGVNPIDLLKEERALFSPGELYAQQFRAFMTENKLPKLETLKGMGAIQEQIKNLFVKGASDFSKLSPDTQSLFVKLLASPDASNLEKISPEILNDAIKSSPVYLNEEQGLTRLRELDSLLKPKYDDVIDPNLPLSERVQLYELEDIPKLMQRQTLRMQYLDDLSGFEELAALSSKMESTFIPSGIANTVENFFRQSLPSPEFLQVLGDTVVDTRTGQKFSAKGLAEMQQKINNGALDTLSTETKELIYNDNYNKLLRIADENKLEDVEIIETLADLQTNALNKAVRLELDYADQARYAMSVEAEKGLINPISTNYSNNLVKADEYFKFISPLVNKQPGNFIQNHLFNTISYSTRLGLLTLLGADADPDGVFYLPGLGRFNWNPARIGFNPLAWLLLPGMKSMLNKTGNALKLGERTIVSKLPETAKDNYYKFVGNVKYTLRWAGITSGHITEETQKMLNTSQNKARGMTQAMGIFSDTLVTNYTNKELRLMNSLYDGKIDKAWLDAHGYGDLAIQVNIAKSLMDNLNQALLDTGVISKKANIPIYFAENRRKSNIKGLFNEDSLNGISLKAMKNQETTIKLRNSKYLEKAIKDEQIGIGDTLHIYKNAKNNHMIVAKADSPLDKSLKSRPNLFLFEQSSKKQLDYTVNRMDASGGLSLSRPFTVKEKQAFGEVQNFGLRMGNLTETISRDIQKAYLYNYLFNSEACVSDKKTKNPDGNGSTTTNFQVALNNVKNMKDSWIYINDVFDSASKANKYGKLGGTYLNRDAFDVIKMFEKSNMFNGLKDNPILNYIVKGYKKGLNQWKMFKTIYQISSHINNFISNITMGSITGHNIPMELVDGWKLWRMLQQERNARKLRISGKIQESDAIMQKLQQNSNYKYLKQATDINMAESTLYSTDIKMNTFFDDLVKKVESKNIKNDTAIATSVIENYMNKFMEYSKKSWNTVKNLKEGFEKFSGELYEGGDLIFKLGSFKRALESGKSVDEAAKFTYNSYFDYGTLAPLPKLLRDTGLIPFVTYAAKSIPAMLKTAIENPGKMAGLALALHSWNNIANGINYGFEDILKTNKYLEMTMPPYMQGSIAGIFPKTLSVPRMPGVYGSLSSKLPGPGLFDTSEESIMTENPDMLRQFVKYIGLSNPLLQLLGMYTFNQDLNFGRELGGGGSNLNDPYVRNRMSEDFTKRFINTVLPNLPIIPGTYNFDKLMNGLVASGFLPKDFQPTPWSKHYTGINSVGTPSSLASVSLNLIGATNTTIDHIKMAKKNLSKLDFDANRETGRFNKDKKDKSISRLDLKSKRDDFKVFKMNIKRNKNELKKAMSHLRARQNTNREEIVLDGTTLPR